MEQKRLPGFYRWLNEKISLLEWLDSRRNAIKKVAGDPTIYHLLDSHHQILEQTIYRGFYHVHRPFDANGKRITHPPETTGVTDSSVILHMLKTLGLISGYATKPTETLTQAAKQADEIFGSTFLKLEQQRTANVKELATAYITGLRLFEAKKQFEQGEPDYFQQRSRLLDPVVQLLS